MSIKKIPLGIIIGLCATGSFQAQAASTPVAEYRFNNSLGSSVNGAPALVPTDPLGQNAFQTDSVLGNNRQVYSFKGVADPVTDQAGLSLDTSGLISNNAVYSVEIVFKFTEHENAWRRIIDVQNRQSDNGFYVDPGNKLDIYPVIGGAAFTNNVYHDVFLTNNNGTATFYLDGSPQATAMTHVMDIDSNNQMNFFLDNVVAGGQREYSSGSVALIRVYNEALNAPPVPSIPEPETYAMLLAGLGLVGFLARRKKQA
ncbi:MAG: hypothetical protein NTAFB09_21190 [Nitrosospira sp.]